MVKLAVAGGDVTVALLAGWIAAAVDRNDVEWARALVGAGVTGPLLGVLPAGEADAVLIHHLTDSGLGPTLAVLPDRPASAALSAAVIEALARAVAGSDLTGARAPQGVARSAGPVARSFRRRPRRRTPQHCARGGQPGVLGASGQRPARHVELPPRSPRGVCKGGSRRVAGAVRPPWLTWL